MLAHLFGYVFLDLDPAKSFQHQVVATREAKRLGRVMGTSVSETRSGRFQGLKNLLGMGKSQQYLVDYGNELVSRILLNTSEDVEDTVWTIIPTAAAACATQAQGVRIRVLSHQNSGTLTFITVGSNDRSLSL